MEVQRNTIKYQHALLLAALMKCDCGERLSLEYVDSHETTGELKCKTCATAHGSFIKELSNGRYKSRHCNTSI